MPFSGIVSSFFPAMDANTRAGCLMRLFVKNRFPDFDCCLESRATSVLGDSLVNLWGGSQCNESEDFCSVSAPM